MSTTISGLPLQGIQARQIILELFKTKSLWSRSDLVKAVVEYHEKSGGVLGKQDPTLVVKKSLSYLKEEGRVFSPSLGLWAYRDSATGPATDDNRIDAEQIDPIENDEADEDIKPGAKTVGTGSEAVYVYFNPSDQELAELKNLPIWPCKIGMTTVLPVENRIISQGVKTAFSRPPAIALVILTDNAFRLEKALHHSLHMAGCESTESLGTEWFLTNPDKIESWYHSFINATDRLSIKA